MDNEKVAGLGRRLGAYIIDLIIILVLNGIATSILTSIFGEEEITASMFSMAEYAPTSVGYRMIMMAHPVIAILYGFILESGKKSATFGKRICKIVVANKGRYPAKTLDVVSRNCIKYLPLLMQAIFFPFFSSNIVGIGILGAVNLTMFIVPLCNSQHRALHDYVGDTVIISSDDLKNNEEYFTADDLHINLPTVEELMASKSENEKNTENTDDILAGSENETEELGNEEIENEQPAEEDEFVKTVVPRRSIKLLCISGQYNDATFPMNEDIVLGRDPRYCNIIFDTNTKGVSRVHCKIVHDNGEIYLEDLHSSYGVYLNGQRIPTNQLCAFKCGDTMRIGEKEIFILRK